MNLGYTGANWYPSGPDHNGSPNISPGGASAWNVNESGVLVASSVTSITSSNSVTLNPTLYTDPYPIGVPLAISSAANNNSSSFVPGTTAAIIAGTFNSSDNGPLSMQWATRNQGEMAWASSTYNNLPTNGASSNLTSEVMKLSGQENGTDYVLQMDFSNSIETPGDQMQDILANKNLYLGILAGSSPHGTVWENAVLANMSYTEVINNKFVNTPAVGAYAWQPNDGTSASNPWVSASAPSSQPYIGSFQSFLNSTYYQGGQIHYFYEHSLDQLRGTWGIDTSTDTAWAVLDVGSGIFAVVPEPPSIRLLAAGALSLVIALWWRRRARIRVA